MQFRRYSGRFEKQRFNQTFAKASSPRQLNRSVQMHGKELTVCVYGTDIVQM
jgi:hypothetical protein